MSIYHSGYDENIFGDMIGLEMLTYQNIPLFSTGGRAIFKCKLPLMWRIPVYLIKTAKKIV